MKNIHVLPTDKPSRLYVRNDLTPPFYSNFQGKPVNIYITNDEEIKEGDWRYNSINNTVYQKKLDKISFAYEYKIILTIDQDLIKEGVQAIDDEFLEWFVKNPSCEKVEINKDNHLFCKHCDTLHSTFGDGINCDVCRRESNPYLKTLGYKIIIPKEEPKPTIIIVGDGVPKQETLEEYIDAKLYDGNIAEDIAEAIRIGAKWQQEKICNSEVIQRIRASKSDAEARRIIKTI